MGSYIPCTGHILAVIEATRRSLEIKHQMSVCILNMGTDDKHLETGEIIRVLKYSSTFQIK